MHGLTRKLIANAVEGVTKRFEKKLEVVGTGYNVKMQGEGMVFKLGYSHLIEMKKPEGIRFAVEGNNITVSGIDKQLVGEVSNKIYTLKKPDPYKGKGLRYAGQVVKLKPGKKAKA
jgi:large subunit ribosomal protein L6